MKEKRRNTTILLTFAILVTGSLASPAHAIKCFGEVVPPELEGTNGADWITGGPGNDVIHGRGGGDILDGEGGDDKICGGDGVDAVIGDDGNDKLNGGAGATPGDTLLGGNGVDLADGEAGYDSCRAENLVSCECVLSFPFPGC